NKYSRNYGMKRSFGSLALLIALLSGLTTAHSQLYSVTDLGTFGGSSAYPAAINNSGTVVGYAQTTGSLRRRGYYYSGGTLNSIGVLTGGNNSYAGGINSSGFISGTSDSFGSLTTHAVTYSGGVLTDIGTLGGTSSSGGSVNDSGTSVGVSSITGDTASHA